MAKDTTSPFTPGRPVPVEFFVGRQAEIERLREKVRKSFAAGRIEVAFVHGERGIGKSSLASFVRSLCERDEGALGIHAFLGGVDNVGGAVKKVFGSLLKEHVDSSFFGSIKDFFGEHVRKVGLFGISVDFAPAERELTTLVNNFAPAMRNLLKRLKAEKKGIVLILDDINGLAHSTEFANWFKSLVDEIGTSGHELPICVILVGLDEKRRLLINAQPSLARVFEPVEIRAWSKEESGDFFVTTFAKANIGCEDHALDAMTRYAGGLPMLAHEIGDAVYSADDDGTIGLPDAYRGIAAAAGIVGRKYLDPVVFSSIRSPQYHTILQHVSKEMSHERFTRSGMLKSLPKKEGRAFDNFVNKMKKLGVIVDDSEEGPGSYRFSNLLHYLYFHMNASDLAEKN